jgi:hypothetical protein
MSLGALWSGTRELHHACERHPVGQRMLAGQVTPQEWADWLAAYYVVHLVIDRTLPLHFHRQPYLLADFAALPTPHLPIAATTYAAGLYTDTRGILGACYVLHAAHRRGGRAKAEIMRASGLSTQHIIYEQEGEVEAFVRSMRDREDLVAPATAAFAAMLATMDEINNRATV